MTPEQERRDKGAATGVGFMGLLGLVFIVLKLVGVIGWSWWLVLLPLYGPGLLMLAVLVFAAWRRGA